MDSEFVQIQNVFLNKFFTKIIKRQPSTFLEQRCTEFSHLSVEPQALHLGKIRAILCDSILK